ncbi:hypothetical protein PC129_g20694 [Phytophthora cactorum]|uniref:Tc1-like transposase DDE domain-containing protein n=1 Tax=Phytophthora cactorum TaxID=29920 RepID=A0A329T3G2_9STRA|nr:hypothetical protein PC112_g20759 [Phytophthora cactorum]KAG2800513.1 hypothetical protein PC111_g19938 [Phytophthora cactorum]KAG2829012.1 hypothetical protein PC113_g21360 [Phytophthora cactorum]KAG2878804.1 hypothetical protein PC114_g22898 [Phytophthora cactorum]KAG2884965.1 hypothetical protein PC115_g21154 [Phytophthora cactorum]
MGQKARAVAIDRGYVAQRSSRNRPRGIVCTRNIYKDFLIRHVIPAIKQQWPRVDRRRPIMIQQDIAKPHVLPHDSDVVAAGMEGGWCIRLLFQPPNSPDLNVLDLELFRTVSPFTVSTTPSLSSKLRTRT